MTIRDSRPNVNVTWGSSTPEAPRRFPCPLCATDLDVRHSRTGKPYCVCITCGVQLFIRGKKGIERLTEAVAQSKRLLGVPTAAASAALHAFHRIEQLRRERSMLEERRRFLVSDDALESAIAVLTRQIADVQRALEANEDRSKT